MDATAAMPSSVSPAFAGRDLVEGGVSECGRAFAAVAASMAYPHYGRLGLVGPAAHPIGHGRAAPVLQIDIEQAELRARPGASPKVI